MIGIDTNILVAFAIAEHPLHQEVRDRIGGFLKAGRRFAITSEVLAEFVHVVTDARRFANPMKTPKALDWATYWAEADDVVILAGGIEANRQWLHWLRQHRLGRKRLLDTLFAAILFEAGVSEIFSLNQADFRAFSHFTLHTIER